MSWKAAGAAVSVVLCLVGSGCSGLGGDNGAQCTSIPHGFDGIFHQERAEKCEALNLQFFADGTYDCMRVGSDYGVTSSHTWTVADGGIASSAGGFFVADGGSLWSTGEVCDGIEGAEWRSGGECVTCDYDDDAGISSPTFGSCVPPGFYADGGKPCPFDAGQPGNGGGGGQQVDAG